MPVMRTALIALSRNKTLQDMIVRVPVSRKMAMRAGLAQNGDAFRRGRDARRGRRSRARSQPAGHDRYARPSGGERRDPRGSGDRGGRVPDRARRAGRVGRQLERLAQADADGAGPGRRLLLRQCPAHRRPGGRTRQLRPGRHGRLGVHCAHDRHLPPAARRVPQRRPRGAGVSPPDAIRRGGAHRRRHGSLPAVQGRLRRAGHDRLP